MSDTQSPIIKASNLMPALISYVDTSERYQYVNAGYERWIGKPAAEIIGKTMAEILGRDAYEQRRQHVGAVLSGKQVTFEARNPDNHRTYREILVTYTPDIAEDGRVLGFVVYVADNGAQKRMEQHFLQLSNNLSKQVLHILDCDPPRISFVSPSYERIWGRDKQTLYSNPYAFLESVHPEDRHKVEAIVAKQRAGQATDVTYRIVRPDGGIRWIHDAASPVFNEEGKLERITGIADDITEAKENELKLSQITELVPALVFTMDSDGNIAYCNHRWLEYTGMPEASADNWRQCIHPDDLPIVEEKWRQSLTKTIAFENEHRILRGSDGEYRWHLVRCVPLRMADGANTQWFGTLVDIDDQKKTRVKLETFWNLRNLLLVEADVETGYFLELSPSWEDALGYSLNELKGKPWLEFVHHEDMEATVQAAEFLKLGTSVTGFQNRYVCKDGSHRWFAWNVHPIGSCLFGTAIDITSLKLAETALRSAKEDAEQANLSKTTFLANMSHEIRTPMTAVLGFTEILHDSDLPEQQRREALARIEQSGKALLKLIDDILDISKIEAGKLASVRSRFSPFEVVFDVVALLRLQAERQGIKLRTKLASSVPEIAHSDAARVRQILTNLIGNAIKFTKEGEVVVEVRTERDEIRKADYLLFEVRDTGIGISLQDQEKLFQPFAQADDSITRQFGGSGLGLLLSKRLAQQLGGDLVLVESKLGKGSRFLARINAGPFDNLTTQEFRSFEESMVAKPNDTAKQLVGAHILVVDDVADNRDLFRHFLEWAGAQVDSAGSGEEAIAKTKRYDYDLILMDIQMPQLDGIQATKRLREHGYTKPILALTAHAMREEISRSLAAGCDAHLTKPVSKDALIVSIMGFLANRPQASAN